MACIFYWAIILGGLICSSYSVYRRCSHGYNRNIYCPSPNDQVLAQQRAEQARVTTQQSTTENPEASLDPAGFIQSLAAPLRQQVLADMDDSMVAVLPPDLAAEANQLRRELEERHRRLMQDRLTSGAGLLSGILRHPGL